VIPFPIIAVILLLTYWPAVNAQSAEPAIIAIVEVQTVMRDAKAAQSIQAQVESKRTEYQAEISAEEERLRNFEQELARQRSVLSSDAFATRRREFETDVARVQRIVADRRRELDQAYGSGVRQIQVEISKIIAEIAGERGITIVMPGAQLLFADDRLQISREVLSRLDERMPDLALQFGPN